MRESKIENEIIKYAQANVLKKKVLMANYPLIKFVLKMAI